jgi:hypothetical protein
MHARNKQQLLRVRDRRSSMGHVCDLAPIIANVNINVLQEFLLILSICVSFSAGLETRLLGGAAVAAGVLACRRAGASRPADITRVRTLAIEDFLSLGECKRLFRAAGRPTPRFSISLPGMEFRLCLKEPHGKVACEIRKMGQGSPITPRYAREARTAPEPKKFCETRLLLPYPVEAQGGVGSGVGQSFHAAITRRAREDDPVVIHQRILVFQEVGFAPARWERNGNRISIGDRTQQLKCSR